MAKSYNPRKISVAQLQNEVRKIFKEYEGDVGQLIDEVGDKVSKVGAAALRSKASTTYGSPSGKYKYARGWTVAKEEGRLWSSFEIHNKNQPLLTHLLEYGHALPQGGRYEGHPIIDDIAEELAKDFEEEIINAIQGS